MLVRPAVEAGERLGFLPGDLAQKVDPYLRPMYDALYEMMGFDRVARFIERNVIEVAPLAFMRGRSLNDSFIILDEAQNTTVEQMKMFLTRIGFGSQRGGDRRHHADRPARAASCPACRHVINVLPGVEGVAFTHLRRRRTSCAIRSCSASCRRTSAYAGRARVMRDRADRNPQGRSAARAQLRALGERRVRRAALRAASRRDAS